MVSGFGYINLDKYNATDLSARNERELYYIKNQSFLFDIQLLIRTLQAILRVGNIKGRVE